MPSLRALECLLAAADLRSVTRAAQHLHLSQPAISHQLAALEREVGTALLIRERRGVRLTAAGRAALPEARRAVAAADDAIRIARAVGQGAAGTVRVVCAQSLTVALLAPALAHWNLDCPNVALSLRESTDPEAAFAMLDSGETDLLLFPDLGETGFDTTTVAEEEVVVALPARHPLASRHAIRPRDLQGQPFVHFAPENRLGTWIESHLDGINLRESVVVRTAVTAHAPQLAAAGLGVTVVPVSAITTGFSGVVRPFEPRWTRRLVAMTTTPRDQLVEQLVSDLRSTGLRVPADIAQQLASVEQSAVEPGRPRDRG